MNLIFASKAVVVQCPRWVIRQNTRSEYLTSGMPAIADIEQTSWKVGFVPTADI